MKERVNSARAVIVSDESVRELLELLKDTPRLAAKALLDGANEGAQILLGLAIKERFTGEGPYPVSRKRLGVVTGRLRRSLRATKARITSKGKVSLSIGSNVKYFGAHEFGQKGQERVKAHSVKAHKVPNAFGRGKTVKVPAHTRKAYLRQRNTPRREPLQAAIKEHGVRVFGTSIEKHLIRLIERGAA